MEIDFSVLDNLKSDALKCPTSEDNDNTRRNTHKIEESQPQGKYEGESGISFHKLNQLKQDNEKVAELYRQEQENIKKAGDFIPEITKGILAADNPLNLLLKAINCIGLMTGNKVFYNQSLTDIKTVYGIGLHDPQAIEMNKMLAEYIHGIYNYNKADRIAADIVSKLYPEQKIEEITALTTKIDSWPYFNIPNTPAIKITKQLINNPNRIQTTRRGQIKLIDYKTGNSDITYKGTDSNLVFTLERKKELFASKIQKGVKVFNFLLQKLNEQNKAEITTFQLDELVEKGIYANKDSARKGVKNILQKIFSIGIKGTVTEYQGRKRIEKSFGESRIIAAYEVKEKNTYVSFPLIIRANIPFYTLLPKWSYKLNDNAYMLLDYISILARQNAEEIKKTGCFNINLDAVRIYLGLPTPKNAGNDPRKLIFEPIEKAITEIEEKQEGTAFKITPCYDLEFKKIQTFLAGYLKIELDQPMREQLIKIANMQEYEYKLEKKRIEKARQEATNKAIESTTKEE